MRTFQRRGWGSLCVLLQACGLALAGAARVTATEPVVISFTPAAPLRGTAGVPGGLRGRNGPAPRPPGPPAARAWPRVILDNPDAADALRGALTGASRLLAQPTCQAVLTDFTDERGRPLREKLEALGTSPPDYLGLVVFRDGSGKGSCRNEGVLAFTGQGHRVVYVCGPHFQRTWAQNRHLAQASVIHEALHTLGLGENPPTSRAITRRVQERCPR